MGTEIKKSRIIIQKIIFPDYPDDDRTNKLYYRSRMPLVKSDDTGRVLLRNSKTDFFTYMNALSIHKWMEYTSAEEFRLAIQMKGEAVVELVGYYIDEMGQLVRECFDSRCFNSDGKHPLYLPYPISCKSTAVAFEIFARTEVCLICASYEVKTQVKPRNLHITFVTTTFKKEDYVLRNVKTLRDGLFSDERFASHFSWKIIDNGGTLDVNDFADSHISVLKSKNVGGSGGFARGMLAAMEENPNPTHVLLMDDDVAFLPESFRRLYMLLSIVKPEFEKRIVSGAMLEMQRPFFQYEDVGMFLENGGHGPVKPGLDLRLKKNIVINENIPIPDGHIYSGWWYCCIPFSMIRQDNLPLPLFVRGDDVEFSIRNRVSFLTMNGICVWHEGFSGKFSDAMELYQVHRNDLILQAVNECLRDIPVLRRICYLFWEELYKFNYKGCDLLLDAVEDYLKGPEYLKSLDGEACMREKQEKDNHILPMTDMLLSQLSSVSLYESEPLGKIKKFIYDYSLNGHRLSLLWGRRQPGIIPYGWGYYPGKQYLASTIYAVDLVHGGYVRFEKSVTECRRLSRRYRMLIKRFHLENARVTEEYRHSFGELTSARFWKDYLGIKEFD